MKDIIGVLPFDPYEDDQDAQHSSWENMNGGGPGIWYSPPTIQYIRDFIRRRNRVPLPAMGEEFLTARADAERDMEEDNAPDHKAGDDLGLLD